MHYLATFSLLLVNLSAFASAKPPPKLPSSPHVASCTVTAGRGDDSPRLLEAVKACSEIIIPHGTTLNISTRLDMTGLVDKHIKLEGTLRFEPNIPYWTANGFPFTFQTQITFWILGGKNIRLDGGGTLDGQGQAWYDAFASNSSLLRPITLTVTNAEGLTVENIHMENSPEWHNFVNESKDVVYNNISIHAVSTSSNGAANTDGWNTYRSDNVVIQNSVIVNGDDCVAFKPNSTNVLVENLDCTGSHGISVGSLGQFAGVFDIVQNVSAINIKMNQAQNGARIKAFAGSGVGSGIVQNVTFQNFVESQVQNPLIVDQCYMTSAAACAQFPSNVVIQDIVFDNISGTSTGPVVADIGCSPDGRCSSITVTDLNLAAPSGAAQYTCQNVVLAGDSASLFAACATT